MWRFLSFSFTLAGLLYTCFCADFVLCVAWYFSFIYLHFYSTFSPSVSVCSKCDRLNFIFIKYIVLLCTYKQPKQQWKKERKNPHQETFGIFRVLIYLLQLLKRTATNIVVERERGDKRRKIRKRISTIAIHLWMMWSSYWECIGVCVSSLYLCLDIYIITFVHSYSSLIDVPVLNRLCCVRLGFCLFVARLRVLLFVAYNIQFNVCLLCV